MNNRTQIALTVLSLVLLGTSVLMYFYFYESRIGPEQPIPFSHRVHVRDKNISCYICHESAPYGARAGIPSLETCMLCHSRIIIHHPEIEKLRAMYEANEPVEWVKVYDMPDFTFFNHSVHLYRKIDCSRCHGNVAAMDRILRVQEFTMDFCIDCHREYNATTDCFTCHR